MSRLSSRKSHNLHVIKDLENFYAERVSHKLTTEDEEFDETAFGKEKEFSGETVPEGNFGAQSSRGFGDEDEISRRKHPDRKFFGEHKPGKRE